MNLVSSRLILQAYCSSVPVTQLQTFSNRPGDSSEDGKPKASGLYSVCMPTPTPVQSLSKSYYYFVKCNSMASGQLGVQAAFI